MASFELNKIDPLYLDQLILLENRFISIIIIISTLAIFNVYINAYLLPKPNFKNLSNTKNILYFYSSKPLLRFENISILSQSRFTIMKMCVELRTQYSVPIFLATISEFFSPKFSVHKMTSTFINVEPPFPAFPVL